MDIIEVEAIKLDYSFDDKILTNDNYFSKEANKKYMSVSKYKNYMNCEAMAKAKDDGLYIPEKSSSLIQGSYIDAWCNGELEKFKSNHPELISSRGESKGQLKAEYKKIGDAIETLENDPLCMEYLQGTKQAIYTAEWLGIWWKICIDNDNPDKDRFTDLKYMANFDWAWDAKQGRRVSFVEAWGYNLQMAIYRKIRGLATGEYLDPFIVAVTKQEIPDKAIVSFELAELSAKLDEVEGNIDRVVMIGEGDIEPKRCEKCEYCRMTKMLRKKDIKHHSMI